jgi:heme-degrading monooxygenase HmoA
MLMAIIEYEMNPGTEEEFGSLLGGLDRQLETIEGFISADAATSLKHIGMTYEVSYWRDADALVTWARDPVHGVAIQAGRDRLLKWYRIRVGEVTRDWTMGDIPADNPAAQSQT